ncbi:alpha/beta fold hydrolase [Roseibium salinum]|uniref:Alpha/beta hydrolase n=1 Tax=Roseibium salinum TaxID=1604349 RepID=A0ABT3R3M7_9HYPH|nr:alpha/beta fold hydrolase [Roseibium sp. DSM 29163]MCX2723668.1 alpha/beta hydrolase [Roseibium sp. DSM 29163]
MSAFLWTRPDTGPSATLLLAHGAGAPMDAAFMNKLSEALAAEGIAVARFEFAYMAGRRSGGSKKPPPRADKLVAEFQTALQTLMKEAQGPLIVGGKSMGGRVAAMLAGGGSLPGRVAGVCCFGYPFHPSGTPEAEWRLAPLEDARRPVLILQGDRDPFGTRAEIDGITLPDNIAVTYLEDGNHDFGPRGKSPATLDGNIREAAAAVKGFVGEIVK